MRRVDCLGDVSAYRLFGLTPKRRVAFDQIRQASTTTPPVLIRPARRDPSAGTAASGRVPPGRCRIKRMRSSTPRARSWRSIAATSRRPGTGRTPRTPRSPRCRALQRRARPHRRSSLPGRGVAWVSSSPVLCTRNSAAIGDEPLERLDSPARHSYPSRRAAFVGCLLSATSMEPAGQRHRDHDHEESDDGQDSCDRSAVRVQSEMRVRVPGFGGGR